MNDLVKRLRDKQAHSAEAFQCEEYMPMAAFWASYAVLSQEASDHIEAQEKLIRDLSDCLEDMTKHYVEVRNDLYGFEATEEIEVIAAGKLIALSKSNPNTPERNDE